MTKYNDYDISPEEEFAELLQGNIDSNRASDIKVLYPYRWVMLASLTMCSTASGFGQLGFAPIASVLTEVYGVSNLVPTMLVLCYFVAFILLNFPIIYVMEKFGIGCPLIFAGICTLLGAWVRYMVIPTGNLYWVLAGSFIQGIGQPVLQNAPAKLSAAWFGDLERGLATAITSLAIPLGNVLGFILPSAFVSEADKEDIVNGRKHVENYILVMCIVSSVLSVCCCIFPRSKPPSPPSSSAKIVSLPMRVSCRRAVCNRNFPFLVLSFCGTFAVYMSLGSVVGQFTDKFGYKVRDNSFFGSSQIVFGIVGATVAGRILDRKRKFKRQLTITTIGTLVGVGVVGTVVYSKLVWALSVALAFLGFFVLPMLPVSY